MRVQGPVSGVSRWFWRELIAKRGTELPERMRMEEGPGRLTERPLPMIAISWEAIWPMNETLSEW